MNKTNAHLYLPLVQALAENLSYDKSTGVIKWKKSIGAAKSGNEAGFVTLQGYKRIGFKGMDYQYHRIAWVLHYGCFPIGVIDHIDGNCINNRIDNLRDATKKENQRNSQISITNTSGITGVCWCKDKNLWESKITVNNKTKFLGRYKTKIAAAYARHVANIEYGFTNRHGSILFIEVLDEN